VLVEKLTERELEYAELLYDSQCLAECLFSNADNLSHFSEKEFIEIRPPQLPYLSWEYGVITDIPELSEKEKFVLRENAGSIIAYGGRLHGKTWTIEKIDICEYIFYIKNEEAGFSSFDAIHIRGILEPIINTLDYHPILNLFKEKVSRHPSYSITTKRGVSIESVNMNIASGARAGDQFFQKHLKRLWIEEAQKENETVFEKRAESRHEIGCIERISGMTNFIKHSPAGKNFLDPKKQRFVINLPQYVNPYFDEEEKQRAIRKYNGEQAVPFRVFIEGEIIEEGISALDMERISRLCYPHKPNGDIDENCIIKNFEIGKENVGMYRALLIVEKPSNIDRLLICADVGREGGTTEIIVMTELKNKWRYIYNITLRNLPLKIQEGIFKYLYQRLKPNYLAVDVTDGTGDALISNLGEDPEIDKNKLIRVCFTENIEVGIETDNEGKPIREKSKLVKKFENTIIWAVQQLCYLLYEPLVFLPLDYKLDEQLNSVIAVTRGNSITYTCASEEDHLWQAFEVFAIARWLIEYQGFTKPIDEFRKKHINVGA